VAVRKRDIDTYEAIIRELEAERWRSDVDARALFRFLNVCPRPAPDTSAIAMPKELR
jgi:hypothetical protein